MTDYNEVYEYIQTRTMYYIAVTLFYGYIIYAFRKTNQFYGLNESSDIIDCIYYTSMVFTGSGYGEIYPQTALGRTIILTLSIVKLFIIVMPLQSFPIESFEVAENTNITINDVEEVIEDIKSFHIDLNKN
jgi:hypothetical protein